MKKSITLYARDFKYPTRGEKISNDIPQITPFKIYYKDPMVSLLEGEADIKLVNWQAHLVEWNGVLQSKLGKLYFTCQYASTHFTRGVPEHKNLKLKKDFVNWIQFDYYVEYYYYLLFSTIDAIGQILNVYYNLNLSEHGIHFNKIKVNDSICQDIIETFRGKLEKVSNYRNSLAHRYPINKPDNRTTLDGDTLSMTAGLGNVTEAWQLYNDMRESYLELNSFIEQLKDLMAFK